MWRSPRPSVAEPRNVRDFDDLVAETRHAPGGNAGHHAHLRNSLCTPRRGSVAMSTSFGWPPSIIRARAANEMRGMPASLSSGTARVNRTRGNVLSQIDCCSRGMMRSFGSPPWRGISKRNRSLHLLSTLLHALASGPCPQTRYTGCRANLRMRLPLRLVAQDSAPSQGGNRGSSPLGTPFCRQ